jgi:Flp pilus assembly protein CpaB
LNGAQQRAYGNAKLTTVYVATSPIPRGSSGSTIVSQGWVKQAQIPTQFRPADALADLASIRNEVTTANLSTGDVLSNGLFSSPSVIPSTSTVASAIPKGDVAITVSVDAVHAVAGLLQPGDQVDVMVETGGAMEQFLYQNVPILAVGSDLSTLSRPTTVGVSSPSTTTPPSGNQSLITFAVPPDAAQRIALAESGGGGVTGSLYLALVPPGSSPSSVTPLTAQNLIPATPAPS